MINNSPLRAFIKTAQENTITREVAWELWKITHIRSTSTIFDSEWKDCEKGHENYDFSSQDR